MLLEIVKRVKQSENLFKVVLIGTRDLEICKSLQQLGIEPKLLAKKSKYGLMWMFFSLAREILLFKPTTILASGQYATILGMTSGYILKVESRIFIRHHSNFHAKFGMRLGMLVDRFANSLSTSIVAVSEVVKEILIDTERVHPSKVVLIHNGIDVERFAEVNPRTRSGGLRSGEKFRIGIVSRLTGWKGVQYSVDAFTMLKAKYPNSHIDIVGAPADSYELIKDKLATLDASEYTLTDWHPDVLGFLGKLDVFVHVPIGPQDEAFGLVYIEALASRTPSIFTVSGVLHELPNPEKYAHIVPYENAVAIFDAIVNIVEGSAPSKKSLPEEWLQQYSLNTMGNHYMKLLVGAK